MRIVKCPRCGTERKVSNDTGLVECYCGYVYEIKDKELVLNE